MLVTAAIAATALMSPAAALASGGASGSGKNSSKSTPAAPAECATLTDVTTTQETQINMVTGDVNPFNRWTVWQHGKANNCGTQTESLIWDISWTNTKTGIVEYPSVYALPVDVAPGGSIDMLVGDGVTGPEPGKSYRFDLSVKSGTTGKVLAQQSVYYTIQ
jgi:hypothetical protein